MLEHLRRICGFNHQLCLRKITVPCTSVLLLVFGTQLRPGFDQFGLQRKTQFCILGGFKQEIDLLILASEARSTENEEPRELPGYKCGGAQALSLRAAAARELLCWRWKGA